MSNRVLRRSRMIQGFMTSAASKATALVLQLLFFPFILHALGTDRYAAFISIQAFLSWTGLMSFGLAPTLPRFIAGARATEDKELQRDLIVWSIILLALVASALAAALFLFGEIIPPARIISSSAGVTTQEVYDAYCTAVGLSCLSLFVAVQPAIRSGYQEIHRTSLLSMAANFIAMTLLFASVGRFASIAIFTAILYAPIIFLLAMDIVALFQQRPYLLARPTNFAQTFKALIGHSSSASAVQVAFLLFAYLPPLVVAHLQGPEPTAAFGTLMQLSIIGSNAFNLIFQPLLAAMADACGHGDWPWIRRNYYRGLISIGAVSVLAIPCMAAFGPQIITLWLRRDIGITNNLCAAFGFYFLLMMCAVYHFYVLSGIGRLRGVGRIYVLQGILAIGAGSALCWKFGATGMSVGLALALLVLTSWYGPLKVRQALAAGSADGANLRFSD